MVIKLVLSGTKNEQELDLWIICGFVEVSFRRWSIRMPMQLSCREVGGFELRKQIREQVTSVLAKLTERDLEEREGRYRKVSCVL